MTLLVLHKIEHKWLKKTQGKHSEVFHPNNFPNSLEETSLLPEYSTAILVIGHGQGYP